MLRLQKFFGEPSTYATISYDKEGNKIGEGLEKYYYVYTRSGCFDYMYFYAKGIFGEFSSDETEFYSKLCSNHCFNQTSSRGRKVKGVWRFRGDRLYIYFSGVDELGNKIKGNYELIESKPTYTHNYYLVKEKQTTLNSYTITRKIL